MGQLCSKQFAGHKSQIKGCYPKDPSATEPDKGNVQKLSMYALSNPDKVPVIGAYLQTEIEKDVSRRNSNRAIVGVKILDEVTTACSAEMTLLIIHIVKVIDILLKSQDVRLKIKGTETLNVVLQFLGNGDINMYRSFAEFLELLVELCKYKPNDDNTHIRLRIASMRSVSKMATTSLETFIFDRCNKLIPSLLHNISTISPSPAPAANAAAPSHDAAIGAEDIELVEIPVDREASNQTVLLTLDPKKSLLDPSLQVTLEQVRAYAFETLGSVARVTTYANIRTLMNPVLEYLTRSELWKSNAALVKLIMKSILESGWSQQGYVFVSLLLQHIENENIQDVTTRVAILNIVTYIISIQSVKGIVSPRALEALSALVQVLLQTTKTDTLAELQNSVIASIATIAKRSQHSSQNIDILLSLLSLLKNSTQDVEYLVLLRAMTAVASFVSIVPVGRFYPDSLVKPLFDESLASRPEGRSRAAKVLQALILSQMNYYKEEKKNRRRSYPGDPKLSSQNTTFAYFSKKQIEDLHFYLFKGCLLKDNNAKNYFEIYKTFLALFRQSRNKEIEQAIPIMFRLQDDANNYLDKNSAYAVHTLIALYALSLLQLSPENKELSNYVSQVIEKRIKAKQLNEKILLLIREVNKENDFEIRDPKGEFKSLFEMTGDQTSVVPENYFNKSSFIEALCKSDFFKENTDEVRQKLSIVYAAESTSSVVVNEAKNDDEIKWHVLPDDRSVAPDTIAMDQVEVEENDTTVSGDVKQLDFVDLGEKVFTKKQKLRNAMETLLDLIPKSYDDKRNRNITVTDNLVKEEEVEEEEEEEDDLCTTPLPQEDSPVSALEIAIPKLFIFDSHEFVAPQL